MEGAGEQVRPQAGREPRVTQPTGKGGERWGEEEEAAG